MKNLLLGIIAINLTFISGNLYLRSVESAQAASQRSDSTLKRFIEENCWVELAIKSNANGERWQDILCYKYDGWGY
tara:strand:- start:78 stop:305 length:228 start_codon:yes stop_codon:yes gene_type:complete